VADFVNNLRVLLLSRSPSWRFAAPGEHLQFNNFTLVVQRDSRSGGLAIEVDGGRLLTCYGFLPEFH
jgi:hypothetical protein